MSKQNADLNKKNNEIFYTENVEEVINFPGRDDEDTKYQDPVSGAHFRYEDVFLRLQYLQQQQKYGALYTELSDEDGLMDEVPEEIPQKKPELKISPPNNKFMKGKETVIEKKVSNIKSLFLGPKPKSPSKSILQKDHKVESNSIIKEKNKGKLSQLLAKSPEHDNDNDDNGRVNTLPSYLPNNWIIKSFEKKTTKELKSSKKNVPIIEGGKLFSSLYFALLNFFLGIL